MKLLIAAVIIIMLIFGSILIAHEVKINAPRLKASLVDSLPKYELALKCERQDTRFDCSVRIKRHGG